MKTITIQISDETAEHIDGLVQAGRYLNPAEYLLMLIEREQRAAELPRWIEDELVERIERHERGEGSSIEWTPEAAEKLKQDFLDRMRRRRGEVA